jgi:hypothetical protein
MFFYFVIPFMALTIDIQTVIVKVCQYELYYN